tara:strand:+ start:313 stop:591 length:279 start_codon:yes stop_codon:yes gene_type:complete
VRKAPYIITDNEVWIEAESLSFGGESSKQYFFKTKFPGVPVVTATALDSVNNDTANINVFIKSLAVNEVTIGVSERFTGTIMVQAMYIKPQP